METNNPYQTNPIQVEDGKTASIVSYITIIGWLIAYFALHKDKKTSLGSFHLKQSLLINLIYVGLNIIQRIVLFATASPTLYYLFSILYVVLFILWLIGLIGAIQGQKKPIPFIGEKAEAMFPNI
ncbi:DUF4870 domain-containing protein [Pedobacter jejuensis]|uniref:DUF4870 domain-containing protein n=1 Tax=Pedobacter jejuensis TaxID=1268550 RepID=A0A3N0BWK0_9SPHI|nr:hypothetical protein [Pedobacter jejuensis]RNL54087.1 hypothetical protein D7004_08275 [Pedobacter jejuensis]